MSRVCSVSSGKARRLYSYLLWCHSELYNLLPQPAEHWKKLQDGCLVGVDVRIKYHGKCNLQCTPIVTYIMIQTTITISLIF